MKILNFRFTIFLLALLFGLYYSMPSFLNTKDGDKISLGLDLQGGLHMLLGVKTDKAIESKLKSIASTIKYFAEDQDILLDELKVDEESIRFVMYDQAETKKIEDMLSKIDGLVINKDNLSVKITLTEEEKIAIKEYSVLQAVDTIRNRLDQFGLAEPTVAKQGKDKILVELPGIKTLEDEKEARELISRPANLQMMAIDEDRAHRVYEMDEDDAYKYGDLILDDAQDNKIKYLVKEIPILDGSKLLDAKVAFDQNNQTVISFTLDNEGAAIFGDFTQHNIGKRLAVVLDGKVYSAPNIRERIGGGSGQISGNFTPAEASSVAIALRSGALLAPVEMLEKRSVGPSLGADSIQASMMALISGFVLVVIFMIIYYGIAGVIANVALITNLVLIIAVMALFGATLTLPGMAGIVLTVGMAVDANVIISERIRELLNEGKSIAKAIEDGYSNAMRAILDANITTLFVAIALYGYGSGPIKGFAVTISIGIIASMITAIIGTHGIYDMLLSKIQKSKNNRLWFGLK
jgi:preprotein translocase subunit SecD